MGLVTIHYRDVNRLGNDLDVIPSWKPSGTPFNVGSYIINIHTPYPCYFDSIAQTVSIYKDKPQDVVILVRAYLRMYVNFRDVTRHNLVVKRHRLITKQPHQKMSYLETAYSFLPTGYKLLGPMSKSFPDSNPQTFVNHGSATILVEPKEARKTEPTPQSQNSEVTVSAKEDQPQTPTASQDVNQSSESAVIKSYAADSAEQTSSAHFEKENRSQPQPQNHQIKAPKKATGTILYQDASNHQIKRNLRISGVGGKDLHQYWNRHSKQIPQGYSFVGLKSDFGTHLKNQGLYFVLIKKEPKPQSVDKTQRPQVSGKLLYLNVVNRQVLKTVNVSGTLGMPIHFKSYETAKYLPKGYQFVGLNPHDYRVLRNHQCYEILIKPKVSVHHVSKDNPHKFVHQQTRRESENSKSSTSNRAHLPQVNSNSYNIGSILVALGNSLNALGRAIKHDRK